MLSEMLLAVHDVQLCFMYIPIYQHSVSELSAVFF